MQALATYDIKQPEDLTCLNEAECEKALKAVFGLERHWHKLCDYGLPYRLPYYTLGVAVTYITFRTYDSLTETDYERHANAIRPLLLESFSWLYERIVNRLSERLDAPVHLSERFSLPGFHVFYSHPRCVEAIAPIHTDCHHRELPWDPHADIDFDHPISFTVPLTLPADGAGLNYWDVHLLDHQTITETERMHHILRGELPAQTVDEGAQLRQQEIDAGPIHHFPYRTGRLTLHSGYRFHQLAPSRRFTPGECRLTLQGHGLRVNGAWELYW